MSGGYKDGLSGGDYCYMEGCIGNGYCPRCHQTNYRLLGYFGAIASAAKRWGVTNDEAERRIIASQEAREMAAAPDEAHS